MFVNSKLDPMIVGHTQQHSGAFGQDPIQGEYGDALERGQPSPTVIHIYRSMNSSLNVKRGKEVGEKPYSRNCLITLSKVDEII